MRNRDCALFHSLAGFQSTVSNPISISVISETSVESTFSSYFLLRECLQIFRVFKMFSLILTEPHIGHQKCHGIVLNLLYLYLLLIANLSLSLVFHALGSADVKRVLSKLFFEPQQCLLTLEARLIP